MLLSKSCLKKRVSLFFKTLFKPPLEAKEEDYNFKAETNTQDNQESREREKLIIIEVSDQRRHEVFDAKKTCIHSGSS